MCEPFSRTYCRLGNVNGNMVHATVAFDNGDYSMTQIVVTSNDHVMHVCV